MCVFSQKSLCMFSHWQNLNRNGKEYFLEGKTAMSRADMSPYHLHVSVFSKFERLNLLESSGPLIGLYRDCCNFFFYICKDMNYHLLDWHFWRTCALKMESFLSISRHSITQATAPMSDSLRGLWGPQTTWSASMFCMSCRRSPVSWDVMLSIVRLSNVTSLSYTSLKGHTNFPVWCCTFSMQLYSLCKIQHQLVAQHFICWFIMLRHVLALTVGNLQGAFLSMCSLFQINC